VQQRAWLIVLVRPLRWIRALPGFSSLKSPQIFTTTLRQNKRPCGSQQALLLTANRIVPPSHISTFFVMNGGRPKSRIRRSRVNLSTSPEEPLDAVASTGTGMRVDNALFRSVGIYVNSSGTELPQSHTEQSPVSTRDAPVQAAKRRRINATSESDPLPAKRARWARADAQTGRHSTTSAMC
jgi:hypothetical protein